MRHAKHIGINELARRLGVAKSTISKAISKHPDISEKTRQRVLTAAAHYQYQPSWIARAMTSKKTGLIGLVMHQPGSGYFIELAGSIVAEAHRREYRVTLDFSGNNPETEREILTDYRHRHIDGVIITPSLKDSAAMLADACGDMPYVIIDHYLKGTKAPFVGNDFKEIGYLATRHLLELGHRHIAYLDGPINISSSRERLAGFLKACREFKTPVNRKWICQGSFDESAGQQQALMLMQNFHEITAFVCASGPLAMGALQAAKMLGKTAPNDISVIGVSALGNISAVSQNTHKIGRIALATLCQKMTGAPVKSRQIIGSELVARGTTASKNLSSEALSVGGCNR